MCASRREGFREGGDRESEKLDRDGGELVEEDDRDCERGSRGVWSVMAALNDKKLSPGFCSRSHIPETRVIRRW